jgi:hypothetical protein
MPTMSQTEPLDQDPVFQLKGSMLAITVLELARNDLEALTASWPPRSPRRRTSSATRRWCWRWTNCRPAKAPSTCPG